MLCESKTMHFTVATFQKIVKSRDFVQYILDSISCSIERVCERLAAIIGLGEKFLQLHCILIADISH